MQRSQCKNAFAYILKRIFMPLNKMRLEYPVLGNKPFLLPVCWVVRWCKWLTSDRVEKSMRELQVNKTATQNAQETVKMLIKVLDLEI